VVDLGEHECGAAPALVAEGLDAALAGAHERELRGDEEPVQGNQHGYAEQEQELGHLRPGFLLLLRGGSSSLMR
jgi:hypothetical protein